MMPAAAQPEHSSTCGRCPMTEVVVPQPFASSEFPVFSNYTNQLILQARLCVRLTAVALIIRYTIATCHESQKGLC